VVVAMHAPFIADTTDPAVNHLGHDPGWIAGRDARPA
jgi:hypothetical protein